MEPITLTIIGLVAGFGGGWFSRQGEVNRLKELVKKMQIENERLRNIIQEQQRQIQELKIRYNALKGYNFVEKTKSMGNLRGHIIQQYAYQEWLEFTIMITRERNLNKDEKEFYELYSRVLAGKSSDELDIKAIMKYIQSRFEYEISSLIPADYESTFAILENGYAA